MSSRLAAAALSAFLLASCEEATKERQEASVCMGLSQADCTSKPECSWIDDRGECAAK
jgi:hypothetical protein